MLMNTHPPTNTNLYPRKYDVLVCIFVCGKDFVSVVFMYTYTLTVGLQWSGSFRKHMRYGPVNILKHWNFNKK